MMDDVLVYGTTQEEHNECLRKLLETIQESGMTLNAEKYEFSRKRVKFLGHIIDGKGISPVPGKIQGIIETAIPHDVSM